MPIVQLSCRFRLTGNTTYIFFRSLKLLHRNACVSQLSCSFVTANAITSHRVERDVILNTASSSKKNQGSTQRRHHLTISAVGRGTAETSDTSPPLPAEVFHRTVALPVGSGNRADRKTFNAVWLRENCRCSACYNAATEQRTVEFHRLDPAAFHSLTATQTDDHLFEVHWADGHVSRYHPTWLESASNSAPIDWSAASSGSQYSRRLWNATQMSNVDEHLERVEYSCIVDSPPGCTAGNDSGSVKAETQTSSDAVRRLLGNLLRHGFAFVDDVPDNEKSTVEVMKRICPPLRTFFGEYWTFGVTDKLSTSNSHQPTSIDDASPAFSDTAYLNVGIGVHTDGTYWAVPPGVQVLHCIRRGTNGTGGDTLLVDGFHVAEKLRHIDRDSFQLLTKLRLQHRYVEPGKFQYGCSEPILRLSPSSTSDNLEMESIRYNPYDRAPIIGPMQAEVYGALAALGRLVNDPSAAIQLRLSPGRMLFVDNWRVLHGRTAFTGLRILSGCYLSRDEWISRAQSLQLVADRRNSSFVSAV